MVIQRGWRIASSETNSGAGTSNNGNSAVSTGQLTSSSEDSNGSWAAPGRAPAGRVASNTHAAPARQPITRQVAINTLAAMHRRFSLPGPVQPHSRPVAEFRASANKSLDMLRQTIQSAVTKEIDHVIKKYLEKFFVPAVNNIRLNLGEESVSEDQVRAVCRAMLDATRALYAAPARVPSSPAESDSDSSETLDARLNKHNSPVYKRKESDTDSESGGARKKRVKLEEGSDRETAPSPLPPAAMCDPHKWSPDRLTPDTLFIMGSHAHKVLGLGNSRGRLYTKHASLLRYPADTIDKEWIATHNLMNAVGGKTYIMVLEDIEELAATDHYRNNALPMLGELTGFKAPPFMLNKMKAFLAKRLQTDDKPISPQPSTSSYAQNQRIFKIEIPDDDKQTSNHSDDFPELLPIKEEDQDFDLIKVDGIKVEDIEDLKVDGIKVEDIDVDDIKVENIDDISVDGIKVEDIKLENENFSMCKPEDDQSNLVDGLLEADIEFLSRNLENIESEADARKTIEKLTGANPDTLTLMGDEFDFGTTLNTNYTDTPTTKCITVASTTSGMVHSVPVAHLTSASRIAPTSASAARPLPAATLTIHSVPGARVLRGLPISTKSGTFSTVMSSGTAGLVGVGSRTHYVHVNPKSFPSGNILHNAIVSRNMIARNTPRPASISDFDSISTTKDMIDNACNSSLMLKKVLTLGSAGASKSFMMQNTQKILSTGYATGSGPPNVVVSSSGVIASSPSSTLSATYATLSALLAGSTDSQSAKTNQ